MKIVQSFWSKPSFSEQEDYVNSRRIGGWLNYKYFLLSSAFSCLTLKRHHKHVELYTDSFGYDLFIKQLSLPYSDVHLTLNELQDENCKLWILGKLLTIKLQKEPFIHVDNDVFVWDKLPEKNTQFIIAQSETLIPVMYSNTLKKVYETFDYVPECLKRWPTIANVGIIGGNDINFFHELCDISSKLLQNNREKIDKSSDGYINQILEEYLFVCLAREKKYPISYLIEARDNKHPLEHVTRFHLTPIIDKYIHLIGEMKQNIYACEQVEMRLKYEFPVYYKGLRSSISDIYPTLFANNYPLQANRIQELSKVIYKLYNSSFSSILSLKFRLNENVSLTNEVSVTGQSKYFIIDTDPFNGFNRKRELIGLENLLTFFETSSSINELIEEINLANNKSFSQNKLKEIELELVDIVTKAAFVNFTLSIVI